MGLIETSMPVYLAAISIGMLHGIEPGHGWPVAATFALRRRNRWTYGIGAALILAVAHLVSSFAVVAVFALANRAVKLDSFDWVHWVAGGILILMAIWQWRWGHAHRHGGAHHNHGHAHGHGAANHRHDHHHEHDQEHERGHDHAAVSSGTLLGLAGFAFALGFVHEEEFAIIALAVGKTSPWLLMGAYAGAVSLSLVFLTTLAILTLNRFEERIRPYHRYLPRISAVALAVMGIAYLTRLI